MVPVSPLGDAAPFPYVVLSGGEKSPPASPSPGREVFDAYACRASRPELAPRRALARALAEQPAPWVPLPFEPAPFAPLPSSSVAPVQPASPEAQPTAAAPDAPASGKRRMALREAAPAPFATSPASATSASADPFAMDASSPLMPLPGLQTPVAPIETPVVPLPPPPVASPLVEAAPSPVSLKRPLTLASSVLSAPVVAPAPVAAETRRSPFAALGEWFEPRRGVFLFTLILLVVLGDQARRKHWWPFDTAPAKSAAATVAKPDNPAVSAPTPAPAPRAAVPVSSPGAPLLVTAVADSPEPSAAFVSFVGKMKINGVFQGDRVRAIVNGRVVYAGDLVDFDLDLKLVGADLDRRQLVFEERGGARLEVRY